MDSVHCAPPALAPLSQSTATVVVVVVVFVLATVVVRWSLHPRHCQEPDKFRQGVLHQPLRGVRCPSRPSFLIVNGGFPRRQRRRGASRAKRWTPRTIPQGRTGRGSTRWRGRRFPRRRCRCAYTAGQGKKAPVKDDLESRPTDARPLHSDFQLVPCVCIELHGFWRNRMSAVGKMKTKDYSGSHSFGI